MTRKKKSHERKVKQVSNLAHVKSSDVIRSRGASRLCTLPLFSLFCSMLRFFSWQRAKSFVLDGFNPICNLQHASKSNWSKKGRYHLGRARKYKRENQLHFCIGAVLRIDCSCWSRHKSIPYLHHCTRKSKQQTNKEKKEEKKNWSNARWCPKQARQVIQCRTIYAKENWNSW